MTAEEVAEKIEAMEAARDKRLNERDENDLRAVLRTPEGRRFVWGVLADSGTFQPSYTGEAASTNFNEGKRSVGLKLFKRLLEVKPETYLQMTLERTSEDKAFLVEIEKVKAEED